MEHKTTQAFETKVSDEGIVETVFAVMGNVDLGNDVIHPGAFAKTFTERGHKVKVLDHHQAQSVKDVIGKPLELRELSREQLPQAVLDAHPDATGGAWAKVQFLMDTPEGEGAFKRIKAGAISEWSFGYDALDKDFSTIKRNGKDVTVRNLRTVKLYELSPVVWGMNSGTMTVSAKANDMPTEGKPWNVFREGSQYCVYKVNEETGEAVGESLGCHETRDEALAQMRALYANEKQRGQGQGQGGEPQGDGGADVCVCPECGAVVDHEKGVPCTEVECPECGAAMRGKAVTEGKAITDSDKNILKRELGDLNMTDLVATHRRLHMYAAQGNLLTGFSRADMNWFHTAAEDELRRRAEAEDREPSERTPLEWGSSKQDDEEPESPEDEEAKHMPSQVAVIAARIRKRGKSDIAERQMKEMRQTISMMRTRLDDFEQLLEDAGLIFSTQKDDSDAPATGQAADDTPEDEGAGPAEIPPTSERLAMVAQLERELELLEV